MDDILNREQAMEYLSIRKDLLHKLTITGQLTSHKIGKYRRYRRQDLDAFIRRREQVETQKYLAA